MGKFTIKVNLDTKDADKKLDSIEKRAQNIKTKVERPVKQGSASSGAKANVNSSFDALKERSRIGTQTYANRKEVLSAYDKRRSEIATEEHAKRNAVVEQMAQNRREHITEKQEKIHSLKREQEANKADALSAKLAHSKGIASERFGVQRDKISTTKEIKEKQDATKKELLERRLSHQKEMYEKRKEDRGEPSAKKASSAVGRAIEQKSLKPLMAFAGVMGGIAVGLYGVTTSLNDFVNKMTSLKNFGEARGVDPVKAAAFDKRFEQMGYSAGTGLKILGQLSKTALSVQKGTNSTASAALGRMGIKIDPNEKTDQLKLAKQISSWLKNQSYVNANLLSGELGLDQDAVYGLQKGAKEGAFSDESLKKTAEIAHITEQSLKDAAEAKRKLAEGGQHAEGWWNATKAWITSESLGIVNHPLDALAGGINRIANPFVNLASDIGGVVASPFVTPSLPEAFKPTDAITTQDKSTTVNIQNVNMSGVNDKKGFLDSISSQSSPLSNNMNNQGGRSF